MSARLDPLESKVYGTDGYSRSERAGSRGEVDSGEGEGHFERERVYVGEWCVGEALAEGE
jgi:hypothetical protein